MKQTNSVMIVITTAADNVIKVEDELRKKIVYHGFLHREQQIDQLMRLISEYIKINSFTEGEVFHE